MRFLLREIKVKWRDFPGGSYGKESACQCRRCGFSPSVGKIPWRRKWPPTWELNFCCRCYCWGTSVVSNSVRPHPWDSPGKNTGVGCRFLLQCVKVKSEVAQSCPTLRNPMELQPTRLFRPWDFPGKSTGVGCCCLLHSTPTP